MVKDGGNGLLASAEDRDALAYAIIYLLELENQDVRAKMGEKARRWVKRQEDG